MKKMLTYLVIAALLIVAAFFVYKKMYGYGMFEKQQNAMVPQASIADSTNVRGQTPGN